MKDKNGFYLQQITKTEIQIASSPTKMGHILKMRLIMGKMVSTSNPREKWEAEVVDVEAKWAA